MSEETKEETKEETTKPSSALDVPQPVTEKPAEAPPDKPKEEEKASFVFPNYMPTQSAGDTGVLFDFTCGARIMLPSDSTRKLRCILLETSTGTVLNDSVLKPGYCVSCSKKYYMEYKLMIGDEDAHKILFEHTFSLKDRDVLVQMPFEGAVGDSIAWFSAIEPFRLKTGAKVHVLMPPHIQEIFEKQYPGLIFETKESAEKLRPYAAYYLGLFFKGDEDWQPYDFRFTSLHGTAASILGMDDCPIEPPLVDKGEKPANRTRPYVCIATHGSSNAKHWCNPAGWRVLTRYLNECGYDVVCIDKTPEVGFGDVWHTIPHGCIDDTGPKPLQQRIATISHAAFFVGLSSGLSWLAWCCSVPVVLISGFTLPVCEFQTPYRVICRHACHGCWNDTKYDFDHHDFMWCPKHKGTQRAFECTKMISPNLVIEAVKRIPGVPPHPSDRK